MAAFGGGILFTHFCCFFCTLKFSTVKSFENTTRHVSSRPIIFHHVSSESGNQVDNFKTDTTEVLSIGFTKGMAAFGGGILFTHVCCLL